MTTTTEPTTTTPAPPAWLNLDAYCSPELRARIATAREHVAAMAPRLLALAEEVAAVMLDFSVECGAPFDDHQVILDPWTGQNRLWSEVRDISTCLDHALGDGPGQAPDWYVDLVAERLDGLSTWAPALLRDAGRISPEEAETIRAAKMAGTEA